MFKSIHLKNESYKQLIIHYKNFLKGVRISIWRRPWYSYLYSGSPWNSVKLILRNFINAKTSSEWGSNNTSTLFKYLNCAKLSSSIPTTSVVLTQNVTAYQMTHTFITWTWTYHTIGFRVVSPKENIIFWRTITHIDLPYKRTIIIFG